MTIQYRVTKTSNYGRRIATKMSWASKVGAMQYVFETRRNYPGSNPRVVKDSARIRGMIP
jgi:hypothetical protein